MELGISLSSEHLRIEINNIHRILKKIHRIYFSNSGRYFLGKTNSAITSCKKHSPKPKPAKSWKKQFFNTFLIRIWIEKSIRQNQDLAKSCKNHFFNTFLIRIWIEKSIGPNQDLAKSCKNQFVNTFLIRIWIEKAFAKTKILPKAGKINFSILFSLEFE